MGWLAGILHQPAQLPTLAKTYNMKVSALFLVVLTLAACSSSRNEVMTGLINQKKSLEDSINTAGQNEQAYMAKSKQAISAGKDSTVWGALADTSGIYWRQGRELEKRLKNVEFSIDSLSKMK